MSPGSAVTPCSAKDSPRASGVEPIGEDQQQTGFAFAPRERG